MVTIGYNVAIHSVLHNFITLLLSVSFHFSLQHLNNYRAQLTHIKLRSPSTLLASLLIINQNSCYRGVRRLHFTNRLKLSQQFGSSRLLLFSYM